MRLFKTILSASSDHILLHPPRERGALHTCHFNIVGVKGTHAKDNILFIQPLSVAFNVMSLSLKFLNYSLIDHSRC